MFIAALFTIARSWKQPKCPLTDEWIKKMWYTPHIKRKVLVLRKYTLMYLEVKWSCCLPLTFKSTILLLVVVVVVLREA